jgi:hypothetical protein
MSDTGILLNYYKQLSSPESDKNKVIRSLFTYVVDKKPSNGEYAMLFKLVKDFDYFIVFDALVSARYSSVDFSGSYWGYIFTICKNLMKESIVDDEDSQSVENTKKLLTNIKTKLKEGS